MKHRKSRERQGIRRAWHALAGLCLWAAMFTGTLPAQPAGEYEVKAAFLYNFSRFVEWPAGTRPADGPVTVCVVGKDPFGAILDQTLRGKTVRNRQVAVRRITEIDAITQCDVAFLGSGEQGHLGAILPAAEKAGVLLVGDSERLAERGVTINLVSEKDTIRFEVNPEAAARARITISSQLLQLARIVHDPRGK